MNKNIKFGFEFECQSEDLYAGCGGECEVCDGCGEDYNLIWDQLDHLNIIDDIKSDGSIDERHGYEINSVVFDEFGEFKNGLMNLVRECKYHGHYTPSPCAIHLHTSGLYKPLNFIKLSHTFDHIFRHIRISNNSDLMHQIYEINDVRNELQTLNNRRSDGSFSLYLRNIINNGISDGSRFRTIRNRINTLEFRPIPNRLSKQYISTWLKIYEGLFKSQSMNKHQIHEIYSDVRNGDQMLMVDKFKDFFKLDLWELFLLTHKITPLNEQFFKDRKCEYLDGDISLYQLFTE